MSVVHKGPHDIPEKRARPAVSLIPSLASMAAIARTQRNEKKKDMHWKEQCK